MDAYACREESRLQETGQEEGSWRKDHDLRELLEGGSLERLSGLEFLSARKS